MNNTSVSSCTYLAEDFYFEEGLCFNRHKSRCSRKLQTAKSALDLDSPGSRRLAFTRRPTTAERWAVWKTSELHVCVCAVYTNQ